MDWISVFQDRDQWQAFVNRNQTLIPQNYGNVLTGKRNIIKQQTFSTLELGNLYLCADVAARSERPIRYEFSALLTLCYMQEMTEELVIFENTE